MVCSITEIVMTMKAYLIATFLVTMVFSTRKPNFFSLFSVVQFRNVDCTTTTGRVGSCLTQFECSGIDGVSLGSCAGSFGVCCFIQVSGCGNSLNRNQSYIKGPGGVTDGSCTYRIERQGSDVCHIRLDFDDFTIASPSVTTPAGNDGGQCSTDSLSFNTTDGRTYPVICGMNTGYHVILDAGGNGDVVDLNFNLGTATTQRSWLIRVTQLECGSIPNNCCFQYYTGLTGQLFSFNWQNTQVQYHLASQDYAICIRQEKGHCCIQYQVLTMFPVSGSPVDGWALDDRICAAECNNAATCTNDFLIIPNAGSNGEVTFTRFCGNELNTFATIENHPVVSCSHPFILYFHTITNGNRGNDRGFALEYRQIPC